MKAQFNSRSSYLAYRAQWKADYQQLSSDIRLFRRASSYCQRQQHKSLTPPEAETIRHAREKLNLANGLYSSTSFLCQRRRLVQKATAMLEELKEAKQEAQRQYLASKMAAA